MYGLENFQFKSETKKYVDPQDITLVNRKKLPFSKIYDK